ncbi:uncharacterized protein K452DRAFT_286795 [Aplosporella prunicola CBS 121167]|uniref:Rhodopsin domain-containing protein n=1 Tax=Aplosporella prunicola CBS 121167 TaxID=1176127 RepID=A0A6A6BIH7_9PEZI|nr:uncharacterized protein K452DRAFT_286795 [Aplosporella prunicola CBS 121167]KAF2142371.1 hypothetical protein K452DRAFT_286795 [Aplosporella prunicola CBS 121167]
MRLPRKQKTILVITFGFGIFAAVVDVVRIAYLQQASVTRLQGLRAWMQSSSAETRNHEQSDFAWYASLSFMWSAIEVNVGIMCGCVPALKPLVSRFMPRILRDAGDTLQSQTHRRQTLSSMDLARVQYVPSAEAPVQEPPPIATPGPDEPMGMMDFLTTPDMDELPQCQRTTTALTNSTRHTSAPSPTFFDFVSFKRKKSLVQLSTRESIFPIAVVTFLFFVWGFAYGLLDVLNSRFQEFANMTTGQSISIHSLYFVGYFVGPVTFGRIVFQKFGFKACFIVGLCIYACGSLIFWPSAVLTSYPAFLISNFIIGLGLSTLEIAANPFIALCGPPQHAEIRLNISQGVQAIATVTSPLLAKKVLFKIEANSLIDVQWTYLGISLFTVLLAVAYFYIPLPEATGQELDDAAERPDDANVARIGNVRVIWITLALGVFAMFCYTGVQEAVSTSFKTYFNAVAPWVQTTNHMAYAHTAFAVGRFLAALVNVWVRPRAIMLVCFLGVMAFAIVAFESDGNLAAIAVVFLYFFEGPIFSLVFAQALRGLGRNTKEASTWLTAAVSGAAVLPPVFYGVQKSHGVRYAYCVPIAAAAFGALLPLYLNFLPAARRQVDPIDLGSCDEHELSTCVSPAYQRPLPPRRRWFGRRRDKDLELPSVHQKERNSWPSSA